MYLLSRHYSDFSPIKNLIGLQKIDFSTWKLENRKHFNY